MHSSRDRILEAAVRVYAEQGFRGATTRRIAEEAGVNEITVFRHFGSKDALITEALRACATHPSAVDLPEVPRDPQRELAAWSAAELADLREHRALIGRVISEMGEHPEIIACTSAGALSAEQRLCAYVERLRAHGLAPAAGPSGGLCDLDRAAVSMLMSALFATRCGATRCRAAARSPPTARSRCTSASFCSRWAYSRRRGPPAPCRPPRA
jgi:AcrR family transcriptional regulator